MVVRQSGIRNQASGISPDTCLTHSEEVESSYCAIDQLLTVRSNVNVESSVYLMNIV